MSNHITKMTQLSIEISIFFKIGMVKLLETLHTVFNVKMLVFQITMIQ